MRVGPGRCRPEQAFIGHRGRPRSKRRFPLLDAVDEACSSIGVVLGDLGCDRVDWAAARARADPLHRDPAIAPASQSFEAVEGVQLGLPRGEPLGRLGLEDGAHEGLLVAEAVVQQISWDDLGPGCDPGAAYGRFERADVLLTVELDRRAETLGRWPIAARPPGARSGGRVPSTE